MGSAQSPFQSAAVIRSPNILSGRNVKLIILPYLEPKLRIGEDMHSSLRVHSMHRDSSHYLVMPHTNLERDIILLIIHAD